MCLRFHSNSVIGVINMSLTGLSILQILLMLQLGYLFLFEAFGHNCMDCFELLAICQTSLSLPIPLWSIDLRYSTAISILLLLNLIRLADLMFFP